jgi:hypothetical protein
LHGEDVHRDPSRISALLQRLANPESSQKNVRENEGDYIDALYPAA